jgi:pimeloyl-ACP methyl ester carboxylesterase
VSSIRTKVNRWLKQLTLALLGLLSIALVVSWLLEHVAEARDRRRFPPTGQLAPVGAIHLHAWVAGTNHPGPTVVFESGLSGTLDSWHRVAPAVAEFAPVVLYERAGVGWSEASPLPHDAAHVSEQLHRLLQVLEVTPPFVLVGHSMGGLYVLGHAAQWPDDVAGAVLVDSSHPDQTNGQDPAQSDLTKRVRLAAAAAPFGVARLFLKAGLVPLPAEGEARNRYVAANSTRRHLLTVVREIEVWNLLTRQVAATKGLAGKPLIVLTAGADHDAHWFELQRDLATLSSLGVQRTITNATHISITDLPEHAAVVASAIREVVEQARKRAGR